jgi:hypothetical protein
MAEHNTIPDLYLLGDPYKSLIQSNGLEVGEVVNSTSLVIGRYNGNNRHVICCNQPLKASCAKCPIKDICPKPFGVTEVKSESVPLYRLPISVLHELQKVDSYFSR